MNLPAVLRSDTSVAAARSHAAEQVSGDERVVLRAIQEQGGLTDDDLEVITGLSHQSASARRNGLVRKRLVRDSGERRLTRSGRKAVVWVLGVGRPIEGGANDRPTRPSDAEIQEAEAEIGALCEVCGGETEAIGKLRRWLRRISR